MDPGWVAAIKRLLSMNDDVMIPRLTRVDLCLCRVRTLAGPSSFPLLLLATVLHIPFCFVLQQTNMTIPPPKAGPSVDPTEPPASPPLLPLPPLEVRWVHAGAQHLDLLPNPITTVSTTYKAFSYDESEAIEARWQDMSEEEREKAVREWGITEGEGAPGKKDKEKEKKDKDQNGKEVKAKSENGESGEAQKECAVREGESLSSDHPVDAIPHDHPPSEPEDDYFAAGRRGSVPDQEIIRSGEEQRDTENGDVSAEKSNGEKGPDSPTTRYKRLVGESLKDYDNLEEIKGVPVSQVSRILRQGKTC